MVERIQEVKQVGENSITTDTTRVVDDGGVSAARTHNQGTATAVRVVWFIAGLLLILLAFRFVFILLGANTANSFASLIYSASYPFARPFFGLFGYSIRYGVSRVELSTLVAMAVYALLAFGIARLITIGQPRSNQDE